MFLLLCCFTAATDLTTCSSNPDIINLDQPSLLHLLIACPCFFMEAEQTRVSGRGASSIRSPHYNRCLKQLPSSLCCTLKGRWSKWSPHHTLTAVILHTRAGLHRDEPHDELHCFGFFSHKYYKVNRSASHQTAKRHPLCLLVRCVCCGNKQEEDPVQWTTACFCAISNREIFTMEVNPRGLVVALVICDCVCASLCFYMQMMYNRFLFVFWFCFKL